MRLVVVAFVLALACLSLAPTRAQAANACTSQSGTTCDQGEAYSVCMADTRHRVATAPAYQEAKDPVCVASGATSYRGQWTGRGCPGCGLTTLLGGLFYWKVGSPCAQRNTTYPPGDAALNVVPISDCVGGCKLTGNRFTKTAGGVTLYGMSDRTYLNEVCSRQSDSNAPIDAKAELEEETKMAPPECTALGNGQTACMKPNGDYCATASTGKTFCWTPGQEGVQVDGEDAQVKGKVGEPVKPPDVAIPDKEWQRKEGHQVTECTGTSCKTSNVTNFSTVPQGTARNSTGDNKPDGTGNTSGNGQQEQGKDSATDSGNCTSPPVCVGDTLKCLHLRYTWKIECNTKGNEITAGVGCSEGDVPVCAGSSCKAEAYASVLQQWKQRCALEAMAQGNKARADGIDNGADAGVAEGIWNSPGGNGPLTLRTDLVQVGGGGPLLPDIEIEGQSWNVPDGFYDAVAAVKMVIVAVCTVIAMFVVGRNI